MTGIYVAVEISDDYKTKTVVSADTSLINLVEIINERPFDGVDAIHFYRYVNGKLVRSLRLEPVPMPWKGYDSPKFYKFIPLEVCRLMENAANTSYEVEE